MKRGEDIEYRDERNDDFAGTGISAVEVKKGFPFCPKGLLFRIGEFIAYYLIAIPVVAFIWFAVTGFTIEGRGHVRALRRELKQSGCGFFVYANHTHWLDAFLGPLVCFPKKAHVIVSPDTVSIKGLRVIVQLLGAIPLPTERAAMPEFFEAVESRINEGRAVTIFPEAHIWPFCTFVRDFKAGSFRYPVKLGAPAVCVCVTYTKRRWYEWFRKTPRRRVFVSPAMYPDASLPDPAAKQKLRDEAFEWLSGTAARYSREEFVRYVKAGSEE